MREVHRERPVLVGVDGSDEADAAVDWAVGEAVARHTSLHVVHAFIWPLLPHVPLGPSPYGPADGGFRAAAEQIVDDAVRRAAAGSPGVAVDGALVTGSAGTVMLTESERAQLVVVGSRGLGGFAGLLLGSVSGHLAAHAPCPVIVLRPAHALRGGGGGVPATCVVGVDDPDAADHVLGFAFAEAAHLGVGLTAVHCIEPLPALYGVPIDNGETVALMRGRLGDAISAWEQKYPTVRAEIDVVEGSPGRVLIEMSRRALLLVVGSHGTGGFRGMLLGSVSRQALHHAAAPVAIVRGAPAPTNG
ncbi:MAG TPA: universal stress protein [Jiangellaceae bacterium]